MARWKAHGRLSILFNWSFIAMYYGFGVMYTVLLNFTSAVCEIVTGPETVGCRP